MYLSRLILDPTSRRVQREVGDAYQLHRTLMSAFADDLQVSDERVLFRVESDARTGRLAALVQSWTMPDWSHLAAPEFRGFLMAVGEPNPALKAFSLNLKAGQLLAFRLRANPTVKRKFESGDHKRVGIYGEEKQLEWLGRKGGLGGFRLVSAHASGQDSVTGAVRRNGHRHKLRFLAVQFDGVLQVAEPDLLERAVRQGIGSGKGMGFGLLSLARPPT